MIDTIDVIIVMIAVVVMIGVIVVVALTHVPRHQSSDVDSEGYIGDEEGSGGIRAASQATHRHYPLHLPIVTVVTEDLERALDSKSNFLAMMSHGTNIVPVPISATDMNTELRTPIGGVSGMLDLLSTTPLTFEQSTFVDSAKTCSIQLLTVINDILGLHHNNNNNSNSNSITVVTTLTIE
jgi:signal transduction histidine kinase